MKHPIRKTKIVATLGPATSDEASILSLMEAGADVFRINFSHGVGAENAKLIRRIRAVSRRAGREVAVMQDLCGPKIRLGQLPLKTRALRKGQRITLTAGRAGDGGAIPVAYPDFAKDVRVRQRVLINDGAIELRVMAKRANQVECRVVRGGEISSNKGINLPDTEVSAPALTTKDRRDLTLGLKAGVDYVALSFVRRPSDILSLRRSIKRRGQDVRIIAKIEKPEAVTNIEAIVAEADAVMVARGDLGAEMDVARVPLLQKQIIACANEADRCVITATQMFESMIKNPAPTRAEVSDVSNAIIDGTDAVMLSGETAVGAYPAKTVRIMADVARTTEAYLKEQPSVPRWTRVNPVHPLQDALGRAALQLSHALDLPAIVTFTRTGRTALFLSKSRPHAPIIAFTNSRHTMRRLCLLRGVIPVYERGIRTRADLHACARTYLLQQRLARKRDSMLVATGRYFGQISDTDRIEIIGLKRAV